MGRIELIWAIIAAFFLLFGIVRGYAKELGVTLVILVGLFLLTQIGPRALETATPALTEALGIEAEPSEVSLFQFAVMQLGFIAIVFAAYHGQTFSFEGSPQRGAEGLLISAAVGLINGYLVAGTLWYYFDLYNYPLRGLVELPLSPLAETMLPYLPPAIMGPEVLTMLIALLILLKVRR